MKHIVYIERDDHLEVVGEYDASPLIKEMSEEDWKAYYASDFLKPFREKHEGSEAALVDCDISTGKIKKDFSGPA